MIRVSVIHQKGRVTIDVRGHANAGEPGRDVICAWVSAITQTCILGLEALARHKPEYVAVDVNGRPERFSEPSSS